MDWIFGEGVTLIVAIILGLVVIVQWRMIYCYKRELNEYFKITAHMEKLRTLESMIDEFNLRGVGKHGDES